MDTFEVGGYLWVLHCPSGKTCVAGGKGDRWRELMYKFQDFKLLEDRFSLSKKSQYYVEKKFPDLLAFPYL
jgi:hypothetical protein